MPRLPAPEDYGMSAPRPSRGVTEVSPVQARPDLATGKAMQDIGLLMQQEAEKLDETVALDALNQLQNKQLDLTYGDNGFTKVQGRGVIDRKITAEFPTQLQTEADRLAGTINSPRARAAFEARAGSVMRGFKANVYTHAAKETETYQVQAFQGAVATGVKAAEAGDFAAGVSHVLPVLEAEIARRNLDTDSAEALRRETLGAVYSTGITKALTDGRPAEAKALLETASPWMTPKQTEHFAKLVKKEDAWQRGDTMVRELLAQGKTTAEVEAAVAAESKKSGDKTLYDSAVHTLGNINSVRAKSYAEIADRAQDEINRGAPWGRIRGRYIDSMDPSVVAAFDQRAKQLATEGKVKTDFEAYYSLSSMKPEDLVRVDLRTYAGKLGDGDLKHFANMQRQIQNKETPDAVKLTAQLSAAHNELGWGNKPADRKKKGAFDQYVNEAVIAEEARTGKKMNDDEREKLIKKAMITKEGPWWSSDEMFYQVKPEKRAEWLKGIPAEQQPAVFAKLGPTERKQLGEALKSTDIPQVYRDAIRKAYKARGVGAPTETEILNAYRAQFKLL